MENTEEVRYPIEIIYIKAYYCPDCNIRMERKATIHSPLGEHMHSICSKCGLEYCERSRAYWGKKPNNKNAVREVVV
jgi:hypothetical protein